jgi:alanyl-tRNA synthetase
MRASEIRTRFLEYFRRNDHAIRPSASLVPGDDPTLLFTNAGMVPFKRVFLGLETPEFGRRATTAQKCVRAGGKHNDLEQVGHTARHHTFFEMLGNFSFGDYFKREAIGFAWEFVTGELAIDRKHLRVSIFHEDDEARALWKEIAGLPDSRIYGLGEKDNFWQMADTGPCGPCSEIYVDLAHVARDWEFPAGASGEWTDAKRKEFSQDAFVEGAEAGRFLEIWNLVFMQFDRQPSGALVPLPKPSVDTGAGLERIAAVMQGQTNNFHTDIFAPLIETVARVVGVSYEDAPEPASYRVLADHARAVAFLLADNVSPSNDGRGYVLRRILRRAVRHAWLMGRREPTLTAVVERVIETMGDVYPELRSRRKLLVETTRSEEERFLATIGEGMARFDELAPVHTTQGSVEVRGTVSGDDAFRLYDTFGFPIDLTELMARERGYTVDIAGFERALDVQREQSKEDRRARKLAVAADGLDDLTAWERAATVGDGTLAEFVGYDSVEVETQVTAVRRLDGNRVAVMLRESPFYAESGGQISDLGEIVGAAWRVDVDDVRKVGGKVAAIGKLTGEIDFGPVVARVPTTRRRDTERNHTATHLLHAALREVLGEHVHQAGSLVAPDRLRFDFSHHGQVHPELLARIEERVNDGIWAAVDVRFEQKPYRQAVAEGAMALFGEKYGDVVRVVSIPGISVELCGGTHVRNTSQIGVFKIVSETGVAANQRRIEAVTARGAYELFREHERALLSIAESVKRPLDATPKRVRDMVEELRTAEKRLNDARKDTGGGDRVSGLLASARSIDGARVIAATVTAEDPRDLQALGDVLRERLGTGVAVLGASLPEGKSSLFVVVTDDLRERGIRADELVRTLAAIAGGRGGGKPHMAQGSVPSDRFPEVLAQVLTTLQPLLARAS